MARRRQPSAVDVPVMPRELLEPRNREVRREWFEHFGLRDAAEQTAAVARARAMHGINEEPKPDPRELLRGLTNDSPATPRPRRTP